MLLEVCELIAGYNDLAVLNGLSLAVDSGEIVALLGPNGAGKSTLLKTVFGLIQPTAGEITFRNEHINGLPTPALVRKGISLISQDGNLFPNMTVLENLEMGAFTSGSKKVLKEALSSVFEIFPIFYEIRKRKAGLLSGGEQQMLATARSLMSQPALLLMDEPSLGLAPAAMEETFGLIQGLNQSGKTILLVEQNARTALQIAHRGYILQNGQVMKHGRSESLLDDPSVLVESYFGNENDCPEYFRKEEH